MNNINVTGMGLLTLALAGALSMGGCATNTTGTMVSARVESQSGTIETRIVRNNFWLSGSIKIEDLRASFAGDMLTANAVVTSMRSKTLELQYKFRWYNAQGVEVAPDGAPWQPLMIYGRETKSLQAVAPDPGVREFKIEIRYKEEK